MSSGKAAQEFSLEALKAGDRSEFARLVDVHYDLIYRLALRIMENSQDAEDVLQETFIKAFRYIKNFDGRSSISTWLYRIATNEALMILRRRRPDTVSIEEPVEDGADPEPMQIVDWCCLPEETLMTEEARAYLDRAVESLSPGLRVVFVLRDLQGLSTRETGEVLDISEMAVKTRLSRARLQLRELLSGYYADRMENVEGKQKP